jgi:hypothetical protein
VTPLTPPLASARPSIEILSATADMRVSLKEAARAMGMGKDVGQPLLPADPARQPLRIPWHASENSDPGTASRENAAVTRWFSFVVPTGLSCFGIDIDNAPASSATVSRPTRSAARADGPSTLWQNGRPFTAALSQQKAGRIGGVIDLASRHVEVAVLMS